VESTGGPDPRGFLEEDRQKGKRPGEAKPIRFDQKKSADRPKRVMRLVTRHGLSAG
jgi:hypothetical protein